MKIKDFQKINIVTKGFSIDVQLVRNESKKDLEKALKQILSSLSEVVDTSEELV